MHSQGLLAHIQKFMIIHMIGQIRMHALILSKVLPKQNNIILSFKRCNYYWCYHNNATDVYNK